MYKPANVVARFESYPLRWTPVIIQKKLINLALEFDHLVRIISRNISKYCKVYIMILLKNNCNHYLNDYKIVITRLTVRILK
jgi:cobalamin biosynthesis Co2+ chelatase CbiK